MRESIFLRRPSSEAILEGIARQLPRFQLINRVGLGGESVSGFYDPARWVLDRSGRRDSLPLNLVAQPSQLRALAHSQLG